MHHEPFKKPPVVEAVVALRFAAAGEWNRQLLDAVVEKLKPEYSGKARMEHQLEFQAEVSAQGEASTTSRSEPGRILLPTEDGTALVGIAENLITVHVMAPYPGWSQFRDRVKKAAEVFVGVVKPNYVKEVAIRYIDRVALPSGAIISPNEYFTVIPARTASMPGVLEAFQCVTQARDPQDGVVAVLTLATAAPNQGEGFVMLYDLNLIRASDNASISLDEWPVILEQLHDRQYRIFRQSITPSTEGLFK